MSRAVALISIHAGDRRGDRSIEARLSSIAMTIDLSCDVTEISIHAGDDCIPDLVRLRDAIDAALAAALEAKRDAA